MKAGRFEPLGPMSAPRLLGLVSRPRPHRFKCRVFASFKRFYVLEADDRGVRTPGCAPSINQSVAAPLNHGLHAIDADASSTAWRCGLLSFDSVSTAAFSPRRNLVKNRRGPDSPMGCTQAAPPTGRGRPRRSAGSRSRRRPGPKRRRSPTNRAGCL